MGYSMELVKSSNVHSVGYEPETKSLFVCFHGGSLYQYHNVPLAIHAAMMNADSVGRFFNSMVKPNYKFRLVSGKANLDAEKQEKPKAEPETTVVNKVLDVLPTAKADGIKLRLDPSLGNMDMVLAVGPELFRLLSSGVQVADKNVKA